MDPFYMMLIAVLCICVYGQLRCNLDFVDPLSMKLGIWDLDGWSITHLLLFFITGCMYPDKKLLLFAYGVVWEGIEHLLGRSRPTWLGGWAHCEEKSNADYIGGWWFGRMSDIIVNATGLAISIYCPTG